MGMDQQGRAISNGKMVLVQPGREQDDIAGEPRPYGGAGNPGRSPAAPAR